MKKLRFYTGLSSIYKALFVNFVALHPINRNYIILLILTYKNGDEKMTRSFDSYGFRHSFGKQQSTRKQLYVKKETTPPLAFVIVRCCFF
jgi:hypothetical protein